jgi:ribonuclease P protein component
LGVERQGTVRGAQGFSVRLRLTGRKSFEGILRGGERKNLGGYTFFIRRRESGPPRLGVLISRKYSRKATDRNRIKRCIREAFRTGQSCIGSMDVLVRPPLNIIPGARAMIRLRHLLGTLR